MCVFQHGIDRVIDSELIFESTVSPQPPVRFDQVWIIVEKAAKDFKCRFAFHYDQEPSIEQVCFVRQAFTDTFQ